MIQPYANSYNAAFAKDSRHYFKGGSEDVSNCSQQHDLKIHTKQVFTDEMELIGSTNWSSQGLSERSSLDSAQHFENLGNDESLAFNSRAYGAHRPFGVTWGPQESLPVIRALCSAQRQSTALETSPATALYSNAESHAQLLDRIEAGRTKTISLGQPLSAREGSPDQVSSAIEHSKTFSVEDGWIILGSRNH